MASVAIGHVWLDERGVAWLDDTNVKVVEVVLEHLAHGASPVSCTPINCELRLDKRFVTSSYSLPFANPLISKTMSSTCRCERIDA
jgi:hypothetical protein